MSLYSGLEKITAGNRDSLLSALSTLCDFDYDFIGKNGIDYLWNEVWEANGFENQEDFEEQENESEEEIELKYESNLEWLLDEVKDIQDDAECIDTFFKTWMDHDGNYYDEYDIHYIRNSKMQAIAVSFVAVHNN